VKRIKNIVIKQIENSIAVTQIMVTAGWCVMNYFCQRMEFPCLSKPQSLATIVTSYRQYIVSKNYLLSNVSFISPPSFVIFVAQNVV